MARRATLNQPDLFGKAADPAPSCDEGRWAYPTDDMDPEFAAAYKALMDDKRARFEAEFARVKASAVFPWRDLTEAMLAEMAFNSNARVLYPRAQADAMRVEFAREIVRVYEIYGEAWKPLIYAVPDR